MVVIELKLSGVVAGIVNKEYKGKLTKKVQFMYKDEIKGIQITEMKLPEDFDISKIKEGSKISASVENYIFENKIYYKATSVEIGK